MPIWILMFISLFISLLSIFKVLNEWPKVPFVIFLSNALILMTYYSPLIGHSYYLANIYKVIPLIIILVTFAQIDPKPNWSYRALCLVLISQVMLYGIHTISEFQFAYYDGVNTGITAMEFVVLLLGGINVNFNFINRVFGRDCGSSHCSNWVRTDYKSGAK